MKAENLHAWRVGDLSHLASVLDEALLGWRRAWGLAPHRGSRVSCAAADDLGDEDWQSRGTRVAPGVWLILSDVALLEVQSLFGVGERVTALARESAKACSQDAARRLSLALQINGDAAPAADAVPRGRWSGTTVADLPCGSRLLVSSSCIRSVLGPSASDDLPRSALPPLSPLLEAASGCGALVEARLADCDLDLAMLQRLQVGDVVRIPHPLARPLSVRAGDVPVFDAFLARSGAYRALELVSVPA